MKTTGIKNIIFITLFIIGIIALLLGVAGLLLGFPILIDFILMIFGLALASILYIPMMHNLTR